MKRRLLTLAAMTAVFGCAGEDQALPLAPPELAVAAAGDVLAADSAGLVCQWGPVEGMDGVWTVLCHREEEGSDTADDQPCICWYLVTYVERRGERIKVGEEFVGCENCNGQDNCTEEQIEIAEEYEDPHYYRPTRRQPSEYHCSAFKDTDFTGGGDGTHGHSVGLIQPKYRTYKPQILAVMNGIMVTSDWRCPIGNAHPNVGGSIGSWHMEGVGGDFAKANGDTLTFEEHEALKEKAEELGARGISRYGTSGSFTYTEHIHIDWRWSS